MTKNSHAVTSLELNRDLRSWIFADRDSTFRQRGLYSCSCGVVRPADCDAGRCCRLGRRPQTPNRSAQL